MIKIIWHDTLSTAHEFASAAEADKWLLDVLKDLIGLFDDGCGNDPVLVWIAEQGYEVSGLSLLAYNHEEAGDDFDVYINGVESDVYELMGRG